MWRVDLSSGAHDVAFASPPLTPTCSVLGTNLGVNGLKAAGTHVYSTNSAQRFFGRLAVDGKGNLAGPVHVIANRTGSVPDVMFDDIALDVDSAGGGGEVWIAAHPSQAVRVSLVDGSQLMIDVASLLNSASAAFGRGSAGLGECSCSCAWKVQVGRGSCPTSVLDQPHDRRRRSMYC